MLATGAVRQRSTAERWIAFYSVGALGMTVQLTTVWLLTGWAGANYLLATALAVEVSILHNFLWHERWTWADRTAPSRHLGFARPAALRRMARFNLANGMVSIWGNVLFTAFFVTYVGTGYLVGNLLAIGACSVLNFVAADRLVFSTEG